MYIIITAVHSYIIIVHVHVYIHYIFMLIHTYLLLINVDQRSDSVLVYTALMVQLLTAT